MSPRGSRRLLLFLMVVSCAPATIKPTPVAVRQGAYHSVRPGENLFRIAQAYNLTYEELARANNIREPHRIYVGQRLLIPGREAVARSVEPAASRPQSDGEIPRENIERTMLWPVSGSVNSGFGPRGSGFHDGVVIADDLIATGGTAAATAALVSRLGGTVVECVATAIWSSYAMAAVSFPCTRTTK